MKKIFWTQLAIFVDKVKWEAGLMGQPEHKLICLQFYGLIS